MVESFFCDQLIWSPVICLPNIHCVNDVGNEYVTLASARSKKFDVLVTQRESFRVFSQSFSTAFGDRVTPSFIAFHKDFSDRHDNMEALTSARDIFSISTVLPSQSISLRGATPIFGCLWSDYFDFYAWMPDKNFKGLNARTMALQGYHEINEHHGQLNSNLVQNELRIGGFQGELLSALLKCWARCFVEGKNDRHLRQIFRSLQLAFHASRMPSSQLVTHWDLGRVISLWISAFEVLFHTGEWTSPSVVLGQISKTSLTSFPKRFKVSRVDCTRGYEVGKSINIIEKGYLQMYRARNDYLHGNRITQGAIKSKGYSLYIYQIAPIIYWFALTQKLEEAGFSIKDQLPSDDFSSIAAQESWKSFDAALDRYRSR